jgi:hypothetical protein
VTVDAVTVDAVTVDAVTVDAVIVDAVIVDAVAGVVSAAGVVEVAEVVQVVGAVAVRASQILCSAGMTKIKAGSWRRTSGVPFVVVALKRPTRIRTRKFRKKSCRSGCPVACLEEVGVDEVVGLPRVGEIGRLAVGHVARVPNLRVIGVPILPLQLLDHIGVWMRMRDFPSTKTCPSGLGTLMPIGMDRS